MSRFTLKKGQHVRIAGEEFTLLHRISDEEWQLQNMLTGELRLYAEVDLLDQFTRKEMSFVRSEHDRWPPLAEIDARLNRALTSFPIELVEIARHRVQYLKEIDRKQPMRMTRSAIEQVTHTLAESLNDANPPGWCSIYRDYRKWVAAGRDLRAIIFRYADRGTTGTRSSAEVQAIVNRAIDQMYMTPERKRVPEIHLEILRQIHDENTFRPTGDKLTVPSRRTIYREIATRNPYEVMEARFGKRRATAEFRTSMGGPETSHPLERVVMDHTPCDMIVVDDNSMLPLGRPNITSALDEHTRCLMGIYIGFEPPSVLSVMRCLKHAILPKADLSYQYPSINNRWDCYGLPEMIIVDNPAEFHSRHFELACLRLGADIQYAKVKVPWYKGKLERFQQTMNHDLMHGQPGTTFSNILERSDYNSAEHAVVLLSTLREVLHKWIVDIYLQTPHRGIKDTPAHRWQSGIGALPPPLPPSASELDIVLGMTVQRVAFHYGVEWESLRYNSPELGELRRRLGTNVRVELTVDPGNLGYINVLDPASRTYIQVPAIEQSYAHGLSLWQNKVIRRYAQQELNGRTDTVALAQAKAEIRKLIDRDLNRKTARLHKRHARFLEGHTNRAIPQAVLNNTRALDSPVTVNDFRVNPSDIFTDDSDADLPVFEAALNLPRPTTIERTARQDLTGEPTTGG